MRIIDLSRELYHRTPSYPGQPPIIHGIWKTHEEAFAESGNVQGNSVMYFSMPDHGGTHIDAPRHFGKSGTPIDEYPLEHCIVPGICIDLRHVSPRAEITPADLEAAVARSGLGTASGGGPASISDPSAPARRSPRRTPRPRCPVPVSRSRRPAPCCPA